MNSIQTYTDIVLSLQTVVEITSDILLRYNLRHGVRQGYPSCLLLLCIYQNWRLGGQTNLQEKFVHNALSVSAAVFMNGLRSCGIPEVTLLFSHSRDVITLDK